MTLARTHAARLNMRFCSCALARARLFMNKMLTYNILTFTSYFRRARASAHEQKRIFRRAAYVRAETH